MNIIDQGIQKGLISISEDGNRITYINQNKSRDYTKPEEKVQADTFIQLILTYGYAQERIKVNVPVTMGREIKYADIVVYKDDSCLEPYILVECKKEEVSEAEFSQAIEQAYSYAFALPGEVKYVWVTSKIRQEYFEVDKTKNSRNRLPDIPQFGVTSVANYKYVYGAEDLPEKEGKQKFFGLSVIEQSELTRRFKQAHDALWAGGQLNPSEAFDELDKLIFCKIWDERKDRRIGEPYDFQIITEIEPKAEKGDSEDVKKQKEIKRRNKENENLYRRVTALYEEGRKKDAEVFRDNIRLTPEKIRTVVGYLESVNLSDTDLDSKGRAFETFMGDYFRGNFGQYFTPRPIVDFAVNVLPIDNNSKVLDTSCGSGGFLLYALDKVRRKAAEIYPNYKNDTKQFSRWYKYWHDFASNNLYGIEINEQISRAAKMNMIIHDDGHTNVITLDGLVDEKQIEEFTKNQGFKYGSFDFIVTNPPFGSTVRRTEKPYFNNYRLGKKEDDWLSLKSNPEATRENQSTEILFIEQGYKFLKPNGFMAIVIPDGVLTNSTLQYVRNQIENWFRIVAVVSMPQTAFTATGAGVKSSVLFLRKWDKKREEEFESKKKEIEQRILVDYRYKEQIEAWDLEKKNKQKNKVFELLNEEPGISSADIKRMNKYKEWISSLLEEYKEKLDDLKEKMTEKYLELKQKELPDYPIFMAIAENIGYDATGKPTGNNELVEIGNQLREFIKNL